MSEFLFFIIGTMLGGLFGVACMCCLQISRLSERKEVDNAKKKCADIIHLLYRMSNEFSCVLYDFEVYCTYNQRNDGKKQYDR